MHCPAFFPHRSKHFISLYYKELLIKLFFSNLLLIVLELLFIVTCTSSIYFRITSGYREKSSQST